MEFSGKFHALSGLATDTHSSMLIDNRDAGLIKTLCRIDKYLSIWGIKRRFLYSPAYLLSGVNGTNILNIFRVHRLTF
jgi:hypothetical protein